MSVDRFGVTEDISGVDPDFTRLCPIHRLIFDADPTHYHGAGRTCPEGGEPLVGYLRRMRDFDDAPEMNLPDWWDLEG